MVSNNTPTKNGSNYAVGLIFFIVGFAMIAEHNTAGGFTFIILGFVFLTAGVSGSKHTAGMRPGGGGFPSASEIREEQASAERKLRKEAMAPRDAGARPGGSGFPSAPEIREEQASAERKLRKEALAPDKRDWGQASPSTQQSPVRHPEMTRTEHGFEVHMTADEISQRREELKGLLDSGIITKDEYYDRLRRLH